jgi:hypothetical protein
VITIIDVDGLCVETDIPKGQSVVQYANEIIGWVEPIYLPKKKVMLVDEEGRLKKLLVNVEATKVAGQVVVGKAIICDVRLLN